MPVDESTHFPSSPVIAALSAISKWETAAELDDIGRYFYHFEDVAKIEAGHKSVLIGHKGSGKTAITKWLESLNATDQNGLCIRLSLKNFDFSTLYGLADTKTAWQNQYVTIWSYIIVCAICSMIQIDSNVDDQQKHYFKKQFPKESESGKFDIESLISRGGGFKAFGFGINIGAGSSWYNSKKVAKYRKTIDLFFEKMCNLKNEKTYYIIFDELDDDYNHVIDDPSKDRQYKELIIGLIRSVIYILNRSNKSGGNIFPLMALRSDIFEDLHFNDKNKYFNSVQDINWTLDKLKTLVAFRIDRAFKSDFVVQNQINFQKSWESIFDKFDFEKSRCDIWKVFIYIFDRTFSRPRDFVAFLKFSAESAVKNNHYGGIKLQDINSAESAYSDYLKREVEDAIGGLDPAYVKILKSVSDLGSKRFSYKELQQYVIFRMPESFKGKVNERFIIETMHYYNVIGKRVDKNSAVFNYHNRAGRFNDKWTLMAHKGLWRAYGLSGDALTNLKSALRVTSRPLSKTSSLRNSPSKSRPTGRSMRRTSRTR